MLKPLIGTVATLIAKFSHLASEFRAIGDHSPAFPCCDLFVGIKSKDPGVPEHPHFSALIFSSNGLTGILDNVETVPSGDVQYARKVRRTSKSVHDNDGACSRSDGRFYQTGIEVKRLLIHIDEHGRSLFVADRVRNRNEGKGWHDHFIAFGNAQRPNT